MNRLHRAAWVMALASLLAGCGRAPSAWEGITREAGNRALTTSGRHVLADGEVTRDEYTAATQEVIRCAAGIGAALEAEDRYGILIFRSSERDNVGALNRCESGDLATIRQLYEARYVDPDREGDVVHVRCFRNAGLTRNLDLRRASVSETMSAVLGADYSEHLAQTVSRCMYDPADHSHDTAVGPAHRTIHSPRAGF